MVVRRLDAALTDDLARLGVRVGVGLELRLADLAEQPEELAAEGALRVAPRRLPLDLEAGKLGGTLLEVRGQGGRRMGDDDRGREGRMQDVRADARGEDAPAPAGDPGEAAQLPEALGARAPDPVGVSGAEGGCIGVDHDVSRRAREQPSLVVDDRPARAEQGTVRNACVCAAFAYCLPCSTWIDHARSSRSETPAATTIASPPIRT